MQGNQQGQDDGEIELCKVALTLQGDVQLLNQAAYLQSAASSLHSALHFVNFLQETNTVCCSNSIHIQLLQLLVHTLLQG